MTLAGATVQMEEDFREILDEGVARLRRLGFDPVAELVRGQPAEEIGKFAKQVGAELQEGQQATVLQLPATHERAKAPQPDKAKV